MKLLNQDSYHCDCCRKEVPETFYVKFPAVDHDQEQEFCHDCTRKFIAWKDGEISISNLFNKEFKLKEEE